jgi:hypothetical protein
MKCWNCLLNGDPVLLLARTSTWWLISPTAKRILAYRNKLNLFSTNPTVLEFMSVEICSLCLKLVEIEAFCLYIISNSA